MKHLAIVLFAAASAAACSSPKSSPATDTTTPPPEPVSGSAQTQPPPEPVVEAPKPPPEPPAFTIPGTGDSEDLLKEISKVYAQETGKKLDVPPSTGSPGGFEAASTGKHELGRVAVRPGPDEVAKYGPLFFTEFARSPVVFVVHADVPVKKLKADQLCGIWTSKITNWKQVGGPDKEIKVQLRPEGASMKTIRANIPCFKNLKPTEKGTLHERNHHLVEAMKTTDGAIGFMPLVEATLNNYPIVDFGKGDPRAAKYPLWISLGLVHKKPLAELSAEAQGIVAFLDGESAKGVMQKLGFVPVKPKTEAPAADAAKPAAKPN